MPLKRRESIWERRKQAGSSVLRVRKLSSASLQVVESVKGKDVDRDVGNGRRSPLDLAVENAAAKAEDGDEAEAESRTTPGKRRRLPLPSKAPSIEQHHKRLRQAKRKMPSSTRERRQSSEA